MLWTQDSLREKWQKKGKIIEIYELIKNRIHVYNIKQVDNNDESGAKTTGLKFTLKKNTSSKADDIIFKSIKEEISNKGFSLSNLPDKPAYKKS